MPVKRQHWSVDVKRAARKRANDLRRAKGSLERGSTLHINDALNLRPPKSLWRRSDEYEFWRHECRDSFWAFFLNAWGTLHGPHARDWWVDRAEIAYPLASWLDYQAKEWLASRARHDKTIRHIAVIVTREFGKTTLMQAWLLWLHLLDVNLSTYIGGEKEEVAIEVLKGIRAVLTGEDRHAQFTQLYGSWTGDRAVIRRAALTHDRRTTVTRKEPSFGVWGVETGLTGRHPDVCALDDPNTYERAASQQNWYQFVNLHCASLAPVIRGDGLFALFGTPYSEADHIHQSLKRDGLASLTGLPMSDFAPTRDGIWHVFHFPGRDMHQRPTVPNVWSESRMNKFERENPDRYAAQILLRPEISEHNPLTLEQIRDCYVAESDIPFNLLRYTLHFDTAFRAPNRQHSNDETVYQVWGHWRDGSGDVVFIEGYGSNLWRGEDFYQSVIHLIQRYKRLGRKIVAVTDESGWGKAGAPRLIFESFCHGAGLIAPPFYELSRGGKKKLEQRIIPAASLWADGHVKLIRTAPGLDRLVEQMSRIGRSAHDDWADCAADVFNPQFYNRQRNLGQQETVPPWISSPQDVILKDGGGGADTLRQLYDAWMTRDDSDIEVVR